MRRLLIILILICSQSQAAYHDNTTDWVRGIDTEIIDKWSQLTIINNQWSKWKRVLTTQPVITSNSLPTLQDIEQVNITCNKNITYNTDRIVWEIEDYWATPVESLRKGSGDCDDLAICKYYKLRAKGFTPDQLNLWIGRIGSTGHITLAVEHDGKEYILDNSYNHILLAEDYMNNMFTPLNRMNEIGMSLN